MKPIQNLGEDDCSNGGINLVLVIPFLLKPPKYIQTFIGFSQFSFSVLRKPTVRLKGDFKNS